MKKSTSFRLNAETLKRLDQLIDLLPYCKSRTDALERAVEYTWKRLQETRRDRSE